MTDKLDLQIFSSWFLGEFWNCFFVSVITVFSKSHGTSTYRTKFFANEPQANTSTVTYHKILMDFFVEMSLSAETDSNSDAIKCTHHCRVSRCTYMDWQQNCMEYQCQSVSSSGYVWIVETCLEKLGSESKYMWHLGPVWMWSRSSGSWLLRAYVYYHKKLIICLFI
jgi:hypothetical protein